MAERLRGVVECDGAGDGPPQGGAEVRQRGEDGSSGSDYDDEFSDESGYKIGADGALILTRPLDESRTIPFDLSEFNGQKFSAERHFSKYWAQRYRLFSKFDEGICMDHESWYSVTPELLAAHMASRLRGVKHDVVIDAFSGAGGNSIQFALLDTVKTVIAIDVDPQKLKIARHNACVYGVASKMEYILGDYTKLIPQLEADVVFLSPPWGGPAYNVSPYFDLRDMRLDAEWDGVKVLQETRKYVAHNVMYYLPRNTPAEQLINLAPPNETVEVESNILNRKVRAVTAYYGDFPKVSQNKKRKVPVPTPVPDVLQIKRTKYRGE